LNYTDEQKKLFKHDVTKHARVLAGPGTGKSVSILHLIRDLLESSPELLVRLVTFTRSANNELAEKIGEDGITAIFSNTVHSYAISLLTMNPGSANISIPIRIVDDWEWVNLVRKDLSRYLPTTVKVIDKLKNGMSSFWESLEEEKGLGIPENLKNQFLGLWEEHRTVFGYTLLAELPYRLKLALEMHSDLDIDGLELLVVDEYQDLNSCDLECIKLLANRGVTVIAVGDDDQSIYGFRNASPSGIRNFVRDYNSEDYPLSISHRCGSRILEWANSVIEGDTTRDAKLPLSPSETNPPGVVENLVFNREDSEASGILKLIEWLTTTEGLSAEDILILTRTKNGMKPLKDFFDIKNLEYLDPSTVKEVSNQIGLRELKSILHLSINSEDSLAWRTLLHLEEGVGPAVIDKIYNKARDLGVTFGEVMGNTSMHVQLDLNSNQKQKVEYLAEKTLQAVSDIEVINKGKCGAWILDQIDKGLLPEIPNEVKEMLVEVDDILDEIELDRYLSTLEPALKDLSSSKKDGYVRLMTLTSSKGLTSKAVIIAGVEGQILPHPNSDRQEERRLLYVGMTRATDYLYITSARRRIGPSARIGGPNVGSRRSPCPFLEGTSVKQKDGSRYLDSLSD